MRNVPGSAGQRMKAYWLQQADAWARLAQQHAEQRNHARTAEALRYMDEALDRYFGRGL